MKIALVILNADPARGGAERYTVDLAAALTGRGHDVYLLATRFARNVEPAKQVRLAGAAGGRIARYRHFVQDIRKHLSSETYDVVHAMLPVRGCDIYHPHAGIEAHNLEQGHLRHSGLLRRAISQVTNRLNRKRQLYADVERQLLEEDGSMLLCLSRAMQQVAESHYELREGQSRVLINGVDLGRYDAAASHGMRKSKRDELGLKDQDVAALFMSNNYRLKGLKQAITALQRVIEGGSERAKLIVVGREPVDEYRRLAERMGVGRSVIFAGSTTTPQAFYAASDLFVLPTAYDSCSLVVLEALAMGRPVITTRKNGASEAMVDGVQGFVTDGQTDLDGLVDAWNGLMNDPLRAKMSSASQAIRARLSNTNHVEGLLEIYQEAKARRART